MSKSVYSLVLTDEIVRAIDSLAYRMNTSRSALIDRILAEKLSMQTPEIRMRNIMENISSFLTMKFSACRLWRAMEECL